MSSPSGGLPIKLTRERGRIVAYFVIIAPSCCVFQQVARRFHVTGGHVYLASPQDQTDLLAKFARLIIIFGLIWATKAGQMGRR